MQHIVSSKYVKITSGMISTGGGSSGGSGGGGLPAPPVGFAYFVDSAGKYFTDSLGEFLLVRIA